MEEMAAAGGPSPWIEVDLDPVETWIDPEELRAELELDEGLSVRVPLSEGSPTDIVERTQRIREQRERERAAVPPVYNFGSEPSWSGGDW
jgi:hypothetical protein